LDSTTALTIYEMFKKLNAELKVTTLIVSHDPSIARHVNRVVAIRDGKMATETVRAKTSGEVTAEHEEIFEELTVLDSAGRLQIPKEYLEMFGIKGRARLELTDEGILVLPTENIEHVPRRRGAGDPVCGSAQSEGPERAAQQGAAGRPQKKEGIGMAKKSKETESGANYTYAIETSDLGGSIRWAPPGSAALRGLTCKSSRGTSSP
jgi:ABC-type multidrug transport system ATPase subunit